MSFATDIARITKKMRADVEEVASASFIELFSSVIRDTPVDVGRLQGNWQTTKQTPAQGRLERTGPAEALADVNITIKDPGVYYLTNNLPYAERIEFGYSRIKAPEGMVRKNILRIQAIARKQAA